MTSIVIATPWGEEPERAFGPYTHDEDAVDYAAYLYAKGYSTKVHVLHDGVWKHTYSLQGWHAWRRVPLQAIEYLRGSQWPEAYSEAYGRQYPPLHINRIKEPCPNSTTGGQEF